MQVTVQQVQAATVRQAAALVAFFRAVQVKQVEATQAVILLLITAVAVAAVLAVQVQQVAVIQVALAVRQARTVTQGQVFRIRVEVLVAV